MTVNRPKGAWVWVAVAAITLASLARAQSGFEYARAYATPVIKLLAASQLADPTAASPTHRAASTSRTGSSMLTLELFPVFFVGLIAPFSLLSARAALCIGSVLRAPNLANLFQRPPPFRLA
jgi:hypothetical protein